MRWRRLIKWLILLTLTSLTIGLLQPGAALASSKVTNPLSFVPR